MYNKIILEGHLTRDIEIKYSQSGSAIANTAIAVSRKWTDNNNQPKEEVMFVDLTFFGRTGEIANQFLRKGSHVLIDGRLQLDQWTDQQSGQKRQKHSVTVETMQMLDPKPDTATNPNPNQGHNPNQGGQGNYNPNQGQGNQGGNQGYAPPPNNGGYSSPR